MWKDLATFFVKFWSSSFGPITVVQVFRVKIGETLKTRIQSTFVGGARFDGLLR